jgi:hypothetical protein
MKNKNEFFLKKIFPKKDLVNFFFIFLSQKKIQIDLNFEPIELKKS